MRPGRSVPSHLGGLVHAVAVLSPPSALVGPWLQQHGCVAARIAHHHHQQQHHQFQLGERFRCLQGGPGVLLPPEGYSLESHPHHPHHHRRQHHPHHPPLALGQPLCHGLPPRCPSACVHEAPLVKALRRPLAPSALWRHRRRANMGQKVTTGLKVDHPMEEVGSGLPSGLSGGVSGAGGVRGGAWASSGGAREPERPLRLDLLLDMPPACGDLQGRHAWNPEDRSLNIFVKDDDRLTFHRHPVAQSTDCIRGKVGYTRGLHVWEVRWSTRQRGTHAVVGVATREAPLHSVGYQSLVGSNRESWGWDLGRNKLYHDNKNNPAVTYPSHCCRPSEEVFLVPDAFLVVLDMDEGTLAFVVEGRYLGVAFRGLRGKKLYPVVSAVWGHCEITMKYIGGLDPEPLPLKDICRRVIRQRVGKSRLGRVPELNLPTALKAYLLYQDRAS
ncbi:protein gustavus isoform X1 [Ixodes scapularis]|uniref:protein gustavus isoform X1 n=2 Tax=Ixodes scapularis TaxID=6945 RepID=UPI001A9E1DC8|nr:protein gustavus isoform X1 [Ixodes scapularis]